MLAVIIFTVLSFSFVSSNEDVCSGHDKCGDCFAASNFCKWCNNAGFNDRRRCGTAQNLSSAGCPGVDVIAHYPSHKIENSVRCNGQTEECGVCTCDNDHYGKYCECIIPVDGMEEVRRRCTRPESRKLCEGRGSCVCGVCSCNSSPSGQRFSGRYCECDDFSCDYDLYSQTMCGGPGVGKCQCGTCVCEPGHTGIACGCTEDVNQCRAMNGLICNGQGTCQCGKCQCNWDSLYAGPTCEDCPTCPGICSQLSNCVKCTLGFERCSYEMYTECQGKDIEIVDWSYMMQQKGTRPCQMADGHGCQYHFAYKYNGSDVKAFVSRVATCGAP